MRTAFADRTARTSKDHSSRTTGTHDPKAIRVQSSRSFMLQRARFIMLLKARRWPVSSQDLPERVIILFTMSNNPLSHDGRGNSYERSTHKGSVRSSTKHQNHHPIQTKSLQANWWSQTGSNRRPPECKSGALPAELWPLILSHGVFASEERAGNRLPPVGGAAKVVGAALAPSRPKRCAP